MTRSNQVFINETNKTKIACSKQKKKKWINSQTQAGLIADENRLQFALAGGDKILTKQVPASQTRPDLLLRFSTVWTVGLEPMQ